MPTPAAPARIWPALFTVTEPAVPTARRPPVMVPVLLVTLMLPPVGPKLAMPKLPPEIVPAFATFATVVKSMPIDPPEMVPVLLVTLTVEAKYSPAVQIRTRNCARVIHSGDGGGKDANCFARDGAGAPVDQIDGTVGFDCDAARGRGQNLTSVVDLGAVAAKDADAARANRSNGAPARIGDIGESIPLYANFCRAYEAGVEHVQPSDRDGAAIHAARRNVA